MGGPNHFHDFGTVGRVPEPHSQLFSSLGKPGYLNKSRNPWNMWGNIIFINLKMLEIRFFVKNR